MYTLKYRWLSHMLEKKHFFQPLVPLCQICGSTGSVIKMSNGPIIKNGNFIQRWKEIMNPWWGASFAAAASFLTSLMQCISFDTANLFWLLLLKMRVVTKCYKMLQNVTKCCNVTLPGSYVHTNKPFSMVIMRPFMLHLVSPPRPHYEMR